MHLQDNICYVFVDRTMYVDWFLMICMYSNKVSDLEPHERQHLLLTCMYEVSSIKNANLSIKFELIKLQKFQIACKKGINVVVRFQYSEIS